MPSHTPAERAKRKRKGVKPLKEGLGSRILRALFSAAVKPKKTKVTPVKR